MQHRVEATLQRPGARVGAVDALPAPKADDGVPVRDDALHQALHDLEEPALTEDDALGLQVRAVLAVPDGRRRILDQRLAEIDDVDALGVPGVLQERAAALGVEAEGDDRDHRGLELGRHLKCHTYLHWGLAPNYRFIGNQYAFTSRRLLQCCSCTCR